MPASHNGVQLGLIQLTANAFREAAVNSSKAWVSAINIGNTDSIFGPWFQPSPALPLQAFGE